MTIIEELEQRLEGMEKVAKAYGIFKEEVEQLQKALAELKESKKEKWKPQIDDKYWFITDEGEIDWAIWLKDNIDEWRIKHLPVFPTKEACERYWHFMDTVKEKSYEFSREEWDNANIDKFELNYDGNIGQFRAMCMQNFKAIGGFYFKDQESVQYIINNFKDELMEYFL